MPSPGAVGSSIVPSTTSGSGDTRSRRSGESKSSEKVLEVRGVRRRSLEVAGRGGGDSRLPAVRDEEHALELRRVRDPGQLGEPPQRPTSGWSTSTPPSRIHSRHSCTVAAISAPPIRVSTARPASCARRDRRAATRPPRGRGRPPRAGRAPTAHCASRSSGSRSRSQRASSPSSFRPSRMHSTSCRSVTRSPQITSIFTARRPSPRASSKLGGDVHHLARVRSPGAPW